MVSLSRFTRLTGLAALALLFTQISFSAVQGKKVTSADNVTPKVTVGKIDADGNQTITLTLAIKKDWYLYANPVGNEDLQGNEIVVKVSGKNKPAEVKINYPAGKKVTKFGITYNIYEDEVNLTVNVRRAAGDTGELELTVHVNSCSHAGVCLLPGEIKLTVPAQQK